MSKTPEEMAEEYGASPHEKDAFLAGYQAAKDTYKDAISAYEDVAKQMLEEAVRIMSPTDPLADADNVINSPEKLDSSNSSNNSNGWISVKERLPEIADGRFISDDVLWISRYGEMHVSCLEQLRHEIYVDWSEAGLLKLDQVTHWQPLPAPPKEENLDA